MTLIESIAIRDGTIKGLSDARLICASTDRTLTSRDVNTREAAQPVQASNVASPAEDAVEASPKGFASRFAHLRVRVMTFNPIPAASFDDTACQAKHAYLRRTCLVPLMSMLHVPLRACRSWAAIFWSQSMAIHALGACPGQCTCPSTVAARTAQGNDGRRCRPRASSAAKKPPIPAAAPPSFCAAWWPSCI